MPVVPVPDTVSPVYRRLLVLVCFAGLALGMAYIGTGMLENALRSVSPKSEMSVREIKTSDTNASSSITGTLPAAPTALVGGGASRQLPTTPTSGFEPGFDAAVAFDVLARLNAERSATGLLPLVVDDELATEAAAWSEQMTRNGYVHSTQDRLLTISEKFGVGGMAENLHAPVVQCAAAISCEVPEAHPTSGVLHVDWMLSAPHRSTILSSAWDRVGVGVYCDAAGRMWATVLFAAPKGVRVSSDDVVAFREPKVAGNDGVTCGGFKRGHNPRWQHSEAS